MTKIEREAIGQLFETLTRAAEPRELDIEVFQALNRVTSLKNSPDHPSAKKSPRRRKGFTLHNQKLFRSLAPFIGRAIKNLATWEERLRGANAWYLLAKNIEDPLVALAGDSKRGGFALAAATGGARRALGLEPNSRGNVQQQEFLRLAAKALNPRTGVVEWNAPDGRRYRLTGVAAEVKGAPDLALVRLVSLAVPAASPEDDRTVALRRGLSAREAGVFALLASGRGNKEISHTLGISYDTARAHVRNIFVKLGVTSRVEAVNAIRNG